MKAKLLVTTCIFPEGGEEIVRLESGSEVTFNPAEVDNMWVQGTCSGQEFKFGRSSVAATEPETADDTAFCLALLGEMEKAGKVLVCSMKRGYAERGYYIFPGEDIDVAYTIKRELYYKIVQALALDASVDFYLMTQNMGSGMYRVYRVEKNWQNRSKRTLIGSYWNEQQALHEFWRY